MAHAFDCLSFIDCIEKVQKETAKDPLHTGLLASHLKQYINNQKFSDVTIVCKVKMVIIIYFIIFISEFSVFIFIFIIIF